jgi:hypothetical protein
MEPHIFSNFYFGFIVAVEMHYNSMGNTAVFVVTNIDSGFLYLFFTLQSW